MKIAKNYTDLNNSACYKIFSYLVLNEKNEEIVKLPIINQLKSKDSDKIFDELFLNEYWVLAVFDNNKLRKRFKLLFCLKFFKKENPPTLSHSNKENLNSA